MIIVPAAQTAPIPNDVVKAPVEFQGKKSKAKAKKPASSKPLLQHQQPHVLDAQATSAPSQPALLWKTGWQIPFSELLGKKNPVAVPDEELEGPRQLMPQAQSRRWMERFLESEAYVRRGKEVFERKSCSPEE